MRSNNDFRRSVLPSLNLSAKMMECPTTVTQVSNFDSNRFINFTAPSCSSIILIRCILRRCILRRLSYWFFSLCLRWRWHFLLLLGIRLSYWGFSPCYVLSWVFILLLLNLRSLLWLLRLEEILLFVVCATGGHSDSCCVVLLFEWNKRNCSTFYHILSGSNANCRVSKWFLSLISITSQWILLLFLNFFLLSFKLLLLIFSKSRGVITILLYFSILTPIPTVITDSSRVKWRRGCRYLPADILYRDNVNLLIDFRHRQLASVGNLFNFLFAEWEENIFRL